MGAQYQSAERSFEAGYDCARYLTFFKIDAASGYKLACKEAEALAEYPLEWEAFKLGFESFQEKKVEFPLS